MWRQVRQSCTWWQGQLTYHQHHATPSCDYTPAQRQLTARGVLWTTDRAPDQSWTLAPPPHSNSLQARGVTCLAAGGTSQATHYCRRCRLSSQVALTLAGSAALHTHVKQQFLGMDTDSGNQSHSTSSTAAAYQEPPPCSMLSMQESWVTWTALQPLRPARWPEVSAVVLLCTRTSTTPHTS